MAVYRIETGEYAHPGPPADLSLLDDDNVPSLAAAAVDEGIAQLASRPAWRSAELVEAVAAVRRERAAALAGLTREAGSHHG